MSAPPKTETHRESGAWTERRFSPEPTRRASFIALVGGLGGVALGAGTFAQWMSDPSLAAGPALLVGGALGTAVSVFMSDPTMVPLRIGDPGVGVERGGAPVRVAWCDIERIRWDETARALVVEAGREQIVVSEGAHEAAVAWLAREALARIPARLELETEKSHALAARAGAHDGHVVAVEKPQVAGRRCKASGTIVTFEGDARLCDRCGQVYHREHVPARCLTCDAELSKGENHHG